MINVYIDPSSYLFLSNNLFSIHPLYNQDNRLITYRFLKDYCLQNGICLNTIDLRRNSNKEDIYVSFDHKNFFKRARWYLKNKNYPILRLDRFKKRILFQFEPPMVIPEVYENIDRITKKYDKLFFTYRINHPKCIHFLYPKIYNSVLANYWRNPHRKFLVMINVNKKPRFVRLVKIYTNKTIGQLLTERIKIIEFFSRFNEIDLYGLDWDKTPPFPYWFYKRAIQKVYKGPVESKFKKLSEYTFAIAFENSIFPGFIGEALFDCFYTGTVPVYLGAPDIEKFVPKNCFVDMRDFKNYEDLREFLKSLPQKKIQEYRENARRFLESEKFQPFTKECFTELFIKSIIT